MVIAFDYFDLNVVAEFVELQEVVTFFQLAADQQSFLLLCIGFDETQAFIAYFVN